MWYVNWNVTVQEYRVKCTIITQTCTDVKKKVHEKCMLCIMLLSKFWYNSTASSEMASSQIHFFHLQNQTGGKKSLLFCINFTESRVRLHFWASEYSFLCCATNMHTLHLEKILHKSEQVIQMHYTLCSWHMTNTIHIPTAQNYMCLKIYVCAKERKKILWQDTNDHDCS
jgi:hypothetical protein